MICDECETVVHCTKNGCIPKQPLQGKTVIDMAREVKMPYDFVTGEPINIEKLKAFVELVRADERKRVTNLLLYMHNKAAAYHNYYKHAAVELNRKAGEGEQI
jgi:hypothetical protein